MNVSASAWTSGCESGWTGYLDESYLYPITSIIDCDNDFSPDCRPEEDLSMVSDASSGPPQVREDDQYRRRVFFRAKEKVRGENRSKKTSALGEEYKNKAKYQQQQQHLNCSDSYENNLDDTASSPALNYSKVYGYTSHNHASQEHFMGFSNNLSTTHFEGNSAYNNQYGFWQSPHQENANYAEPSN